MITVTDIGPAAANRLAALADGEGCFYISAPRLRGNYYCSFIIKLRADDEPLLARIQEVCGGIGRLVRQERRNGWAPTVAWTVERKAEVGFLRDLFELYPLWSKKQRDFAVWARAVDFWLSVGGGKTDWTPFREAREELRGLREYREAAA